MTSARPCPYHDEDGEADHVYAQPASVYPCHECGRLRRQLCTWCGVCEDCNQEAPIGPGWTGLPASCVVRGAAECELLAAHAHELGRVLGELDVLRILAVHRAELLDQLSESLHVLAVPE